MRDFRQLKVWERAHELTLLTYRATADFAKYELYGITSQMRRASSAIPANIAEGCGRSGNGDLHRFLSIAQGSAVELEYFSLLSRDLGILNAATYERLQGSVAEVQRILAALMRKVDAARKN